MFLSSSWFFGGSVFLLSFAGLMFFVGRNIPDTSYAERGYGYVNPTYKHNALMYYSKHFCLYGASLFVYIGTSFFVYATAVALKFEVGWVTVVISAVIGLFGFQFFDTLRWETMTQDGFISYFATYVRWASPLVTAFAVGGFFITWALYTVVTLSEELLPITVSSVVKEVRSTPCGKVFCAQTYYRTSTNSEEYLFPYSEVTMGDVCEIHTTKLTDVRKKITTGEVVETLNERRVHRLLVTHDCLS